jgi:glyoxylase-like metal-dependent hydrolase (beta-lactamase superfamily II)
MLTDTERNLSALAGISFKTDPADVILEDTQQIEYAGVKLKVLHTPGHSPGGISLYNSEENILFSGDALFADSIGRTDFPGSDITQLITGIKEKILTLPDETRIYPGHGPGTTVEQEKRYNQYLQ